MKKITRIEAIVMSLILVFLAGFGNFKVFANNVSWTDVDIKAEYELWEEFQVPKRQITSGDKTQDAQVIVTLPDGTTTKEDTVKLGTPGKYTVTYTAKVNDKAYVEEKSFMVQNNLFTFNTENSSAEYGKYRDAKEVKGLMVRLAEGDTLRINEPIDVSKIESNEWLIRAFATPDQDGYADFRKLRFTLTDSEDPDITLYFGAKQTSESDILPYTYLVAGGNDQTPKGLETSNGQIHEEGYFGSVSWHCFGRGGELCQEYVDEQMLDFKVDFSTMTVYSKESMIADLDSAKFFDTVWEGFPSGKAYLTVTADLYSGKTANFCLVKAGNVDLSQTTIKDEEPPVITVNSEYKKMPGAVKGGCYQHIPTATAKDVTSGECEVTTKVYYNYQQPGHTVLDVTDGTFKTEKYGYYAIVFEATDSFGNLGQEILWIKAEDSLKKPTIQLKSTPQTEWIQGEKYVPMDYTYTCHSGKAIFNAYATKDGKTYNLNDGFRFEEKGTYHIIYEIKDCAGQTATQEFDMEVKTGDKPVLGQDVEFDNYILEESEYVFPKVIFNDYRNGKKETKVATGKITDASGTKEVKAGDTYKVTVDKNGEKAKISFICENATYDIERPVIKTWGQEDGRARMYFDNFFIKDGVKFTQNTNVIFTATEKDGSWTFVNKLLAEDFQLSFQSVPKSMEYDSIVITIVDSKNADEKLTVEFPYEKDTFSVVANGVEKTLKRGSDLKTYGNIAIDIKDGELYVAGTSIKKVEVPKFTSGDVYLSMGFKNAKKNAKFILTGINNQPFGSSKVDKEAPKIVICGVYGGSYKYNEEVTLPKTVAGDVLNPNMKFTMSVMNGKKYVKDINGTELKDVDPTKEYTIKTDTYGKYSVMYTAYEGYSEKDSSMTYAMHIVDDVEPEIKYSSDKVTEAKVGDDIVFPNFEVTDNETAQDKLQIRRYVEDAHGVLRYLSVNSNAITASEEGKYKMMVIVVDEAGNVKNDTWTVTVTAK